MWTNVHFCLATPAANKKRKNKTKKKKRKTEEKKEEDDGEDTPMKDADESEGQWCHSIRFDSIRS